MDILPGGSNAPPVETAYHEQEDIADDGLPSETWQEETLGMIRSTVLL